METKEKKGQVKTSKRKAIRQKSIVDSKSVSQFFGINKKEVDGLEFQKKVRNEWQ